MEEFRDIKGYEGLYQVSNLGRVRSLNYNHTGETRVLKARMNRYGYLHLGLRKNSKKCFYTIHRLVAMAFIPNPLGLPCVNHKDECKTNNCVENLEWCTVKYNTNYGTGRERMKVKLINHPSFSKRVYQYTLDGSFVRSYPSLHEAARQTNTTIQNISLCCNGRNKSARGYIWSYTLLVPKGKLF